jgi:hypothetical protein
LSLRRFVGDRRGGLRVSLIGVAMIIVTFMVWLATFSATFMVVDMLTALNSSPEVMRTVRICNIAAGLCLISEIVGYLIWMFVDAFRREEQTYYGGIM